MIKKFLFFCCFYFNLCVQAQELGLQNSDEFVIDSQIRQSIMDPLRPSKAAFYSAVLPGLGQVYNKKFLENSTGLRSHRNRTVFLL